MSSAFIFLAAKVEEQPKKIEYVIKTYYYFNQKGEDGRPVTDVDVRSQEYLEKVQELVINENILLQTLGFNVTIDHSNTHVVKLCQLVKAPKELSQLSYFLSTNSLLLTNMCLQFSSEVIAAICIHLACKWSDWQLKRSKENKDWWQYVAPTLTGEKLEEISKRFLSVMEKADPKLKRQLLSRLKMPSDSSPNSRSSSPAPFASGRSSQHGTPHRPSSQGHSSHNTFTPERGHSSKLNASRSEVPPAPPAQTYAEHRERSRTGTASTDLVSGSKQKLHHSESPLFKTEMKPYHTDSPLIKGDLKRPYSKESSTLHPSSKISSSGSAISNKIKTQDPAALPQQSLTVPGGSHNPYSKPPRNHDSSRSRHHHRPHMGHSTDHSPHKKPRMAGENGNGEQRPPLPPQPPLPRPPPPP